MFLCMRTTIHIPDDLVAEVKKLSAESHTTVTALVEDALRERLSRRRQKSRPKLLRLTTYGKGGLQPGADLDDSAALLDLMESNLDSHRR
jgi:hypothetical protein